MNERKHRRRNPVKGKTGMSAVSNGHDFAIGEIDGRSKRARRYRDVRDDILYRLHYPTDLLTKWSVKQLSCMIVLLEESQRAITAGDSIDMDAFVRLSGAVRRHMEHLGLGPAMNGNSKTLRREAREFELAIGGFTMPPETK